jgi:transketolase
MKDPFMQRLIRLAEKDDRILLVVGDLGFGMVEPFVSRFPKQFLNAGVAEQNMIGMATGMALEGYKVFAYSIANFAALRPLEQIRNDAAYHGANVNVVAMGGGFSYGALGFSHHATEDLAILRALPGLTVVAPSDDWEAAEATEALARTPGTGYLRLDKSASGFQPREAERFELGRARVLREGTDLALVATGGIVGAALEAADELAAQGVRCRVLSVHTLKPLDEPALIAAARETKGVITVEEHSIVGGLGSAVAECLMDRGAFPRGFHRVALRAGFSTVVGSQSYLRGIYGMDRAAIVKAARSMLEKGVRL